MKSRFLPIFAFLLILSLVLHPNSVIGQCSAPTNTYNLSIQVNSADIGWSFVSGAKSYKVKYRVVGTTQWTTKRSRHTDITLTGLQSGTTYEWKVKSVCKGSSSSFTPLNHFTTLSSCPTPTPFNPLGVGSHQATLIWLNINNQVDSYNVRWRELGSSNWLIASDISTNLYIVYNLTPMTTYEYQVQSNCGNNNTSPFSNSVLWTTPENVCTAPQDFQVTSVGVDFVSLSWSPVGGTEHYRVRYREQGAFTWLFKDFIGVTSTTIDNLFPATTYEAQVQSECTLGATDWSDLITFTTQQIQSCDAPQNLFASMITATSTNHNWDPVIGALQYTMRRRVAGASTWTFQHTTTETSLVTYLLDPGTTYEFQVQAHCTIGDSPYSNSAFYTTQGDPPCPEAMNLQVSGITPTSADFDWDPVPGVLHYKFEWRVQGAPSWEWVITTSNHISRTGLLPATTYEWRVQTLCTSGGTYTISGAEIFQTAPPGQCTVPSGLFVLGVGQTQATLLWGSVPEASNYDARIRPTGTTNWTVHTNIPTNLKVVSGLTADTEYEWQVQANCPSGSSGYSASHVFTTQSGSGGGQFGSLSSRYQNPQPVIFPNPTSDYLIINNISKGVIRIFDVLGKLTMEQTIRQADGAVRLDLNRNIKPGLYVLQFLSTDNQLSSAKFRVR